MRFKPTILATVLASWAAFLLIFSWLPLVRCVLDGDTYQWGTSHFGVRFSAAGIGPDLWLLVVKSTLLLYFIQGLLRGSDAMHRTMLLLWNFAWPVDGVLAYLANPEGLMFHGDTLGLHLNLGKLVPVVTGLFAVLTLVWIVRDRSRSTVALRPPWTATNRGWLVLCLALLPVQFLLLRFGAPHGTTDAIGVLLTIAQAALLVPLVFYPRDA